MNSIGQHRTMGAVGFGGSFAPIVQYEKWEIHPVFPHFPYFRSGQNLPPNLLVPLCGVAIAFDVENEKRFSSRIQKFFRRYQVSSILKKCNAYKEQGFSVVMLVGLEMRLDTGNRTIFTANRTISLVFALDNPAECL